MLAIFIDQLKSHHLPEASPHPPSLNALFFSFISGTLIIYAMSKAFIIYPLAFAHSAMGTTNVCLESVAGVV